MNSKIKYSLRCTLTNVLLYSCEKFRKDEKTEITFCLNYSKYEFDKIMDYILSCIKENVLDFINLKNFNEIDVNLNNLSESNEFDIRLDCFNIINDNIAELIIYEYDIKIYDDNISEYNKMNFINILKSNEKNAVKSIKKTLEDILEIDNLKDKFKIEKNCSRYEGDYFYGYKVISKK